MMLKATDIRRGMVITIEGVNFVVLDFAHHTPGNLRAMVQTKLRNMNNGALIEKPVSIEVPDFVELSVIDTPPSLSGATATNQYKEATLETKLKVQVPPFVKPGEKIRIDTRTGEYKEVGPRVASVPPAAAASAAGIRLTINSGFRTLARQQYFWNCYQTKKCNGGHLAAHPGTSNHGKGQALDINTGSTSTATYRWMAANAARFSFRRTVSVEPWHWEYLP